MMGDLSLNFSHHEFACKCGCGTGSMNPRFMEKLQRLRTIYDKPFSPTSGLRCETHNKAEGGKPYSYHLLGRACDIPCHSDADRRRLVDIAVELGFGGIGIARSFVHVDDRPKLVARLWLY